jgi:hypothetical protein
MFCHIIHVTMKAFFKPRLMLNFCRRQIRIANANLGKAQFAAQRLMSAASAL